MTKKKLFDKPPIPLGIQPHDGERSPHILNLRSAAPSPTSLPKKSKHPEAPFSFEERVAAFDERVKDVPDFLRNHAEHFSKIVDEQKNTWQQTFSSFIQKAGTMGSEVERRLEQTAAFTKRRISRKSPSLLSRVSPPRVPVLFLPRWVRSRDLGLFICLLVLLTIPLQALLMYRAIQTTQNSLQSNIAGLRAHGSEFLAALQSRDLEGAHGELGVSLDHVKGLRLTIKKFGPLRALLPERLKVGYAALEIAEVAALSSQHILEKIMDLKAGSDTLGTVLSGSHAEVVLITKRLQTLLKNPTGNLAFGPLYGQMTRLEDGLEVLSYFAGTSEEKHILLVFENPRELRATGGFLGSLALLSIHNGVIKAVEVPQGGSYDFQGQLTLRRISPEPLHLINPRFELQDANWWPDFPTSARKISELYEAGGGPTLDGVIAVTARVGETILARTGPLKTSGGTLTADTFIDALQDSISADRAVNRRAPKKIISELFPLFTEEVRTLAGSDPAAALSILTDSLDKKDIQIWSRNETAQAALRRLGVAGEMIKTSGDYLSVVTANVGGGKTDGVVTETINHKAQVGVSSVRETVTITREHNGKRGNIRTGHQNISYVRVYVPENARLISARGFAAPESYRFERPDVSLEPDPDVRFEESSMQIDPESGAEIWQESGKTVFGHWLTVKAGETAIAELTYELPLSTSEKTLTYTLTFDPQAGKRAHLKSEVRYEPSLQLISGEGSGLWQPAGWNFEGILEKPLFASGVLYRL